MNYDCELIRDIAPLYQDCALGDRGKEIVDEHLSECSACKKFYADYSDEVIPAPHTTMQSRGEIEFARKIKVYRQWQVGLFIILLLALLTMALPWFGTVGVTAMTGTVVLRHPLAMIGTGLFLFAIWYHHRNATARLLCGATGWSLLFFTVIYDFLTLPFGSIAGIQIGSFHFDMPFLSDFNLSKCFEHALPGFYFGILALLLVGIIFFMSIKKITAKA